MELLEDASLSLSDVFEDEELFELLDFLELFFELLVDASLSDVFEDEELLDLLDSLELFLELLVDASLSASFS